MKKVLKPDANQLCLINEVRFNEIRLIISSSDAG